MNILDFKTKFESVIDLPRHYPIYDLSCAEGQQLAQGHEFGIGIYLERRPNVYVGEQYEVGDRNIHMGIDIQAPAGTRIAAFYQGKVWSIVNNDKPLDYGPTLVTEHFIEGNSYWVLWGHLGTERLKRWKPGDKIESGQWIADVGGPDVNGGWPPHLHFQVSLEEPSEVDMPGVVGADQLEQAKRRFPDPRCFLGRLY